MNKILMIKDKKYDIVSEEISNEFRKIYTLKDSDNVLYRLLVEDYREATFMYDKFQSAVINKHYDPKLKTVNVEDIKIV